MVITIGEIVDELIPFSSLVRSNILSGFPYVTASIRGGGNCTRLYISVMQMSEHFYAVAVTDDVFNGNRYIPTGNPDKPFIHEKYFISGGSDEYPDIKNEYVRSDEFHNWLFNQLHSFGIIRFNPDDWSTLFTELGFNSVKIRRVIDKEFSKNHCIHGTIRELIELVNIKNKQFDLSKLYEKELSCVYAKLKSIGIIATINSGHIIHTEYERKG